MLSHLNTVAVVVALVLTSGACTSGAPVRLPGAVGLEVSAADFMGEVTPPDESGVEEWLRR